MRHAGALPPCASAQAREDTRDVDGSTSAAAVRSIATPRALAAPGEAAAVAFADAASPGSAPAPPAPPGARRVGACAPACFFLPLSSCWTRCICFFSASSMCCHRAAHVSQNLTRQPHNTLQAWMRDTTRVFRTRHHRIRDATCVLRTRHRQGHRSAKAMSDGWQQQAWASSKRCEHLKVILVLRRDEVLVLLQL